MLEEMVSRPHYIIGKLTHCCPPVALAQHAGCEVLGQDLSIVRHTSTLIGLVTLPARGLLRLVDRHLSATSGADDIGNKIRPETWGKMCVDRISLAGQPVQRDQRPKEGVIEMHEYPLSDQIVDALEIAFRFVYGSENYEDFQAWIGEHAWLDCRDGGDRFLFHGGVLLRDALDGIEKGVFSPPRPDKALLLLAERTLEAIEVAQEIATTWGMPKTLMSHAV
ncbi:hypothetical protein N6L26_03015 [Qipengyuania sp. SS22]|uniref:hypothetical protein n=1 Tax=Qipengyuania sp. SS22 TaxID=2979461 RepID=UPI0021E5C49B|nr:hypothetical protein [Qipengyuania sp. SS22]UYH55552.1 hypothetical protein N6L26_03015 [Qipengyuania sp. SS22]